MPLFATAIFGFFGSIIQKIGEWFLTAYLTGALKSIAIFAILVTVVGGACFTLVTWVNSALTGFINSMGPIGHMIVTPIAAMLPETTPQLVTAILTYYTVSTIFHITVEVAKMKARWAEKALGYFKA